MIVEHAGLVFQLRHPSVTGTMEREISKMRRLNLSRVLEKRIFPHLAKETS
jgi:hypothetical protein